MAQKTADTREKILEAAKSLFVKNGFHETSMSAIAEKAGLGKGTLYWYFSSKDELFNKMLKKEGEIIIEEIHNLCNQEFPPEEILREFIKSRIDRMLKNKKTTRMFLDNENYINREFKNILFEIYFTVIDELQVIIQKGIDEGSFRNESPRYVAAAVIGLIHAMGSLMITGEADNVTEMVDFISRMILKGIGKREVGV